MGKEIKAKLKYIMSIIIVLITMFSTFVLATSTIDVTPPRGKIEVKEITQSIEETTSEIKTEIEIEIKAKDDICEETQIKYYVSIGEISDATEIAESSWKDYTPGITEKLTGSTLNEIDIISLVLKDADGNTSLIYSSENVEYTIAYNANGGTSFDSTVATKTYYGMPFMVTTQAPTREDYFFTGWSTNANATTASYKRGEIIPANVFVGGSKTIELYAVWAQDVLLSDVVESGDYVDLPVSYDNVDGNVYNGWRVISKDVDLDGNASPGTVNLVSAGIPLTYYHYDTSSTSVTALTDNFLTTAFSDTENYTYRKNGFSPYKTLTEVFTNKYIATKADGITPQVRAMKAEDIYEATNLTSMSDGYNMELNHYKYDHLFANESIYWLASQNDTNNLWKIKEDAYVEGDNSNEYGIRPVVQLRTGTTVTGVDSTGEWQIHIKAVLEKPSVSGTYTYNKNEQTLVLNDYDSNIMSITGNKETNAGTYTATVTLKDTKNYEWSDGTTDALSISWTIEPRDISIATIDAIEDQTWLGNPLTPTPTVKDGDTTLVNNTDYTLSYSDNNAVGTGTVIVTGTGNYTGTNSTTFVIDATVVTVMLDQQGGNGGTNSVTAIYGVAMPSITLPTRLGYTFGGYYTETDGGGTQYYTADGSSAQIWDQLVGATLYAKWIANNYTVTASAGTGGSISPSGTATYAYDSTVTYKITSNSGYAISSVTIDGTDAGVLTSVTLSNIAANHTISVTFKSVPSGSFSTNGEQTYTVPETGIYKLEVKGAGGANGEGSGAKGGYSMGYKLLEKGTVLYIGVGGSGGGTRYNGGGSGGSWGGGGGGGATHIATVSGTLASIGASNLPKVLIIAGGGGGGASKHESWGGVYTYGGGAGGGASGGAASKDSSYSGGEGGTQSSGASFGAGSSGGGGGGGGGLYGGTGGGGASGGGGGSGYTGGVPSFTYEGTTYSPTTTTGGGAAVNGNGSASISFVRSVADGFEVIGPHLMVYSGGVQTYTAPKTGLYKIEAYGAGGGNGEGVGGNGGYSVGYKTLNEGEQLYVVIGGSGAGTRYNGGGSGGSWGGGGGGGATHIATVSGTLSSLGSGNLSNILLIAGGGGGGASKHESWGGVYTYSGGAGGGANGGAGSKDPSYDGGEGATQSSGYAFGTGGDAGGGGGGAGLYGGIGGGGASGGGGGSGYIGGIPAVTYNGTTYSPSTQAGAGSAANANGKVVITLME